MNSTIAIAIKNTAIRIFLNVVPFPFGLVTIGSIIAYSLTINVLTAKPLNANSYISCTSQSMPVIFSFKPDNGPVGTLVTITGTNLYNPTTFTIGGMSAIAVSNNGINLVGMVMPGATTGSVSVSTDGGTIAGGSIFTVTPTLHPAIQQESRLVGSGSKGTAWQGISVSLSADGNTAIVGGATDNNNTGAAWIYTRLGGGWKQQGSKLVGAGAMGNSMQGISVSLSADGNTAIVGADGDNYGIGAAWIYTRSSGVWTQQGSKLVGAGATGKAYQGMSVSLSADGNTAMVGGSYDNNFAGASWVYTRTDGVWKQQGSKLVGTGATGAAWQGGSVSLSADGNTAMVGGIADNSFSGAVWAHTRSGGIWMQQGSKLVGTGATGTAWQGISVSLSADGNTAIVGGATDNIDTGAAWIYKRSGRIWSQQGSKLVGTGATVNSMQGSSVSLSADGNTAMVGAYWDNQGVGAAWVYTCSRGVWTQQGYKLIGSGSTDFAQQGQSVSLSADGNTAIVGGYGDNDFVGAASVFVPCISPGAPTVSGTEICSGDTASLSGTGIGTLGWYNAAKDGKWLHGGNRYTSLPLSTTTYYVQDSTCTASDTRTAVLVTVNTIPAGAKPITGVTTACAGQNSVTYTVPAITKASSYTWTLPTGATGTSKTNSITVNFGSSASSGNISVNGNNDCGVGGSTSLAIILNSLPADAEPIRGITAVCAGQNSVTYTVPVITKATSYSWTLPTGATGTSKTSSIMVNFGASAVSGNISVKGQNDCGGGGSSSLAISVNPKPVTPVISINGNILHSNASYGNQWYDGVLIPGATNQDYTFTAIGNYTVIVTLDGCASEPSVSNVVTSIDPIDYSKKITAYPNPVINELYIKFAGNIERADFEILNIAGQVVYKGYMYEKTDIQMSDFLPGIYILKLKLRNTFEFRKVLKL